MHNTLIERNYDFAHYQRVANYDFAHYQRVAKYDLAHYQKVANYLAFNPIQFISFDCFQSINEIFREIAASLDDFSFLSYHVYDFARY